jgi:hypothetical protein
MGAKTIELCQSARPAPAERAKPRKNFSKSTSTPAKNPIPAQAPARERSGEQGRREKATRETGPIDRTGPTIPIAAASLLLSSIP